MVVAFLLLFLASGVGIIYFYFQNMALGLEIEKLEASVADLTAEVARKTATISEKDVKIQELTAELVAAENELNTTVTSMTPADLGFVFSANGRRVYGDWVIEKKEWTPTEQFSITGSTNGATKYSVVKTDRLLVQDAHCGWADVYDWKKESGKYSIRCGGAWWEVDASVVVEEVTLDGGVALIIRGNSGEGSVERLPNATVPYLAMVRNDKPLAPYNVLHFTAPEGAGIGVADFRAFVQSISLIGQ